MVMLFGEGFKCNKEHNLKANEEHQVMFFIMLLGGTNKDIMKNVVNFIIKNIMKNIKLRFLLCSSLRLSPTHKTTKICEDQNTKLHKAPLKHLRETPEHQEVAILFDL